MVSENSYSAEKGLYNPVSKDSVQKECWILSNVCEHSGLYSLYPETYYSGGSK